ncbi:ABC transporter permease [Terrimonas sp. NA20]|uniref:ABC transporter permease n=1 Tax=Terrimonas ginsenosidimutans TaxID=2908004 RepID=A0ABS9KN16_9BACT|nr:ABC transporter permease [Terrimonas ginsenosidimutans]MCG2613708.1 ABC transporter permease [Terrimonas ginsenosidimutans]
MLKNYFKTAWRNLVKNKFYSVITIAGLTAGLCVGIMILLWVQDETGYDAFHSKAANLYKLENRVGTGSSIQIWQNTASPIGKLAAEELPEVKGFTRVCYNYFYDQFTTGDRTIYQKESYFVDPSFFSLFDFGLIKGNKENPFPDNQSVVLTASAAKKYFGDSDPIGKVITSEDTTRFTVTGVIADFPHNSAFNYEMMFPLSLYASKLYGPGKKNGMTLDTDFSDYNYNTFLLLSPTVSLTDLSTKLRNIHLRIRPEDTDVAYLTLPVAKMHLYKSDGTDAGMETVRMFTIIAVLILVIACINYVNLSTARAMLRSKEVSLRKIIGAGKMQLFLQFVLETVVLFFIASVAAIALIPLLLPVFNSIAGKQLQFDIGNMNMWIVIGGCVLATLLVSSIYPALLLSSFEPLKALKGKAALRINDVVFRKALVIVQFAFSVILIAGTFVIGRQLNFIRSKQLGYDKENVLSFSMRYMGKHYDAVKANLLKQPGVVDITRSNNEQIVSYNAQTGNNDFDGKQVGETLMIYPVPVDKDYIPFFKIDMAAGKNFSGLPADSMHFILNETAVRNARIKDPIGKRFKLWDVDGIITGVVKDFHFASMRKTIEPVIFYYRPSQFYRMHIKTTGKDAASVIAAAEVEWKKYNPQYPFEYTFLDDTFNQLYQTESRTGTLFNIFAGIAILISCLGLLGLTAYTAQLRTREIGVRKVLGASVSGMILLLAKDFLRLVLVGILVAIPVAWFVMNKWMQDFAYRTDLSWTVFLVSGLLAVLIALVTVSFQSVKAALVNPVKSLKQAD